MEPAAEVVSGVTAVRAALATTGRVTSVWDQATVAVADVAAMVVEAVTVSAGEAGGRLASPVSRRSQ